MTYTLVWKEFREQRAIWLAVALMALLVLMGLKASLQPGELTGLGGLGVPGGAVVLLCLAGVYGLACGASMFAGEVENRTMPFLDTLPATRADLWRNKALFGLFLSVAQGLVLATAGQVIGLEMEEPEHLFWVLPLTAAEAFAWGLVGSAMVRSALPAAALGAIPLALSWLVGGVMFWPPPVLGVVPRVGLLLLALLLSRRLVSAPDRTRGPIRRAALRTSVPPLPSDGAPSPIGALVWLTLRQGWAEAFVLSCLAFIEGMFLPAGGLSLWLFVTLAAGVLCGTGAFRDEQAGESARFLGEQRLPPGLFWIVKLGLWLGLGLFLLVLMFVSGVMAAGSGGPAARNSLARALLLETQSSPLLLGLGLLYGFSVGQLVVLVVRKPPASVVLATLLAAPAALIWLPSAIMGGLPTWQALIPAALLLGAGYLVRREWMAERIASPRAVLTLVGVVTLAVAATAGAMAWRVEEVPDGTSPFDVVAFERSLPTPEQNMAGSLIRRAVQGLRARLQEMEPQEPQGMPAAAGGMGGAPPGMFGPPPGAGEAPAGMAAVPAVAPRDFSEEAGVVAGRGWGLGTPELGRWLDRLFEGEWAGLMLEAADKPLGVIENPDNLRVSSTIPTTHECGPMSLYFTARAMQLQAAGKDREALRYLECVLALSRNMRNQAVPISYFAGLAVERRALVGLQRWLERVGRKPELLRAALEMLARHEAEIPPITDSVMAEYLVFRNSLLNPNELARMATPPGRGETSPLGSWVASASQAPWERLRMERLLNAVFTGRLHGVMLRYRQVGLRRIGPPGNPVVQPIDDGSDAEAEQLRLGELVASSWLRHLLPVASDRLLAAQTMGLAWVRGTRLVTALALYQAEQGKPAAGLDALVPKYLPEPLTDPFSDWPFHYRVSQGEKVAWHVGDVAADQAQREVSLGQGIVWSVGPDGTDDGGQRQGSDQSSEARFWSAQKVDLIFLVPVSRP